MLKCSGTPPRPSAPYGEVFMKPDVGIDGCGHDVSVMLVPADPVVPGGHPPLFRKDAAVFICDYCDFPGSEAVGLDEAA